MCINSPQHSLTTALRPGCHPRAHWRIINPGTTTATDSQLVAACTTCGREWHLRLTAVPITAGLVQPDRRRAIEDMDRAYEKARALVASGHTISDACKTVGMRREQYTRRRNGLTKGAR